MPKTKRNVTVTAANVPPVVVPMPRYRFVQFEQFTFLDGEVPSEWIEEINTDLAIRKRNREIEFLKYQMGHKNQPIVGAVLEMKFQMKLSTLWNLRLFLRGRGALFTIRELSSGEKDWLKRKFKLSLIAPPAKDRNRPVT